MPHSLSKKGHCALPSISFYANITLIYTKFLSSLPAHLHMEIEADTSSVYSYLRRLTFDIARVAFAIAVSDRHVRPFANMSCLILESQPSQ